VGNSLISGSEEELKKFFGEQWHAKKAFNWEEEFADVFDNALPEGERGFDVVIGNPPYITLALGKKQKFVSDEELAYFTDKYPNSMEYKGNTYTLFVERAIQYLKMNGMLSFIIPNTILSAYHFREIRGYILDTCKILQIVDIHDKVFKDAEIGGNTILILEREKSEESRDKNNVKIIKIDNAEQFIKKSFAIEEINQRIFRTIPDKKFLLNKSDLSLLNKLEKGFVKLGEIATFYQGVITGDNKKYLSNKPESSKHQKIIRGKDIERYSLKFGGIYVYFDKEVLWSNTDENMFLVDEKIISRQTSDHLVATYDNEKYFSLDSTHVIIPTGVNIKYLLALFNSKLLNHYYQMIVPEAGRTFAQVKIVNLKQLPIKNTSLEIQQEFASLVDRMLSLNQQLNCINVDFQHYLNLRPHSKVALRSVMDALPVSDKEALKDHFGKPVSTVIVDKFEAFYVLEEGEWLVFVVGYSYTSGKGKLLSSSNVRALRLRIPDISMCKFIYYSLKDTAPGKLGSGNILEQLQKLKIPRLVTNGEDNRRAVEELMVPFLVEVAKKETLEREIKEIDDTIDKKVYALYGLTDEEIRIVDI
jgi:tRNA1(Val) A37 N6-methylase TrmN6